MDGSWRAVPVRAARGHRGRDGGGLMEVGSRDEIYSWIGIIGAATLILRSLLLLSSPSSKKFIAEHQDER